MTDHTDWHKQAVKVGAEVLAQSIARNSSYEDDMREALEAIESSVGPLVPVESPKPGAVEVENAVTEEKVRRYLSGEFKLHFGAEGWSGKGYVTPTGQPHLLNLVLPVDFEPGNEDAMFCAPPEGESGRWVAVTVDVAALALALGLAPVEDAARLRAELEALRDEKDRLAFLDDAAQPVMASWEQAHKHHADEPYIGCVFCRDKFAPVEQTRDLIVERLRARGAEEEEGKQIGTAFGVVSAWLASLPPEELTP